MGTWLLYAEGETQSVQDDLHRVAEWLADHRGVYCVRHEGDAFRYDYRPLLDLNDDGERQLPKAIFLQRRRDAKLFPARPVTIEWVTLDPEEEEDEITEMTLISIKRVVRAIEREYGTFTLPNQTRRPPRPVF